ncbi:MAG: DUF2795 domain-containing protein [Candidatus Nanopelagicales bacterium]|jgi:hypothetical protein
MSSSEPGISPYDDPRKPGMPPGLTAEGAELRSRIAASLTRGVFPASRQALVVDAESQGASPEVVSALRRLPGSTTFESLADVALALGLGHEERPGGSRA